MVDISTLGYPLPAIKNITFLYAGEGGEKDMNKDLRNLIFLIASAQTHSDEGKVERNQRHFDDIHQDVLDFKNIKSIYGYDGKDKTIMSAIKVINSHPYMGANYYVKADNCSDASIVYFNIKIGDKRYQVSFHTFSKELKKLRGKGSPCRWEKKIGSRETCQLLLKLCGEESEVK